MTAKQGLSVAAVIALFLGVIFVHQKCGGEDTGGETAAQAEALSVEEVYPTIVVDVNKNRIPEYYCSYFLSRNFGVMNRVGTVWVETKAWMPRLVEEAASENLPPPDLVFMADLLKTLASKGILEGVDFGRPEKDRLVIQWPGAPFKRSWVTDTKFFEIPRDSARIEPQYKLPEAEE